MNTSIILLSIVGLMAGMLSSSIGFGDGILLLSIVTPVYDIEVTAPVYAIAQLLSNASYTIIGWKSIEWGKALWFLLSSIPLTTLSACGLSVASKNIMTIIVDSALILFTIQKLRGKLHFPQRPATMVVDGCVTGFINGILSVSGPLNSAVFLTLDLSPVSYIAGEATATTMMHVVKVMVYDRLDLVSEHTIIAGLGIAVAMIVGNYLTMRFIKNIDKKKYRKVVTGCIILLSLFLIISTMC